MYKMIKYFQVKSIRYNLKSINSMGQNSALKKKVDSKFTTQSLE